MVRTAGQFRFCYLAIAQALDPLPLAKELPEQPGVELLPSPAEAKKTRPFSQPVPGADSPRMKQRRLNLWQLIPPPPPGPPPKGKNARSTTAASHEFVPRTPAAIPLTTAGSVAIDSPLIARDDGDDIVTHRSRVTSLPIHVSSSVGHLGQASSKSPETSMSTRDSHSQAEDHSLTSSAPTSSAHLTPPTSDPVNHSDAPVGKVDSGSPKDAKEAQ